MSLLDRALAKALQDSCSLPGYPCEADHGGEAKAALVTPEGRALADLVDAAEAWHALGLMKYGEAADRRLYETVVAFREAVER